ncbi:MAG: hypothetical protein HY897_17795 [Deltaproteobacteria bacterium]|nr:hypothetical protein [Deltaproteobacteria bacterium]
MGARLLALAAVALAAVLACASCGDAATTANTPPMAFAGFDLEAEIGAAVFLDGTASSDPEGDGLTYVWTLEFAPEGSAVGALPDDQAQAPMPSFVPDVEGVYLFGLIVSDGSYTSLKDLVAVTVAPAGE